MRTKRFGRTCSEKAAKEFVDVERQRADLAPVPIVLPPKRDGVVGDGDEPVIGDGDAVRVAREVVQHVGGAAKGRLGVDHPRLTIERSEKGAEGGRRCSAAAGARETRRPCAKRRLGDRRRVCRERPAAAPGSGRKKRRAGVDPPRRHRATSRPPARRSGHADDAIRAHNTLSAENTHVQVYYPFHPLHGAILQVVRRPKRGDGAVSVMDPTGSDSRFRYGCCCRSARR